MVSNQMIQMHVTLMEHVLLQIHVLATKVILVLNVNSHLVMEKIQQIQQFVQEKELVSHLIIVNVN